MLKIKNTAEIVTLSELDRICDEAELTPEFDAFDLSLTDILFDEVLYSDGEYKRLSRHSQIDWKEELNEAIENKASAEEIFKIRVNALIQNALAEAGVEDYVLVEIGV